MKHLFVALLLIPSLVFGSAAIFSGNDVKILKNNLDFNGQSKALSGTVDPTSVATSAPRGSLYLNTSSGKVFKKTDAGSSTNWDVVGNIELQETPYKNLLNNRNAGFEQGTSGWTVSGGDTISAVTSGANLLLGRGSITWDSAGSGRVLTHPAITVQNGNKGTGLCAFMVAVPSGTATHVIRVFDGSNVLVQSPIASNVNATITAINFSYPSSGTIQCQLVSVAANEPLIAVDNGYLGDAYNIGSTQITTNWAPYTPTFAGFGTVSNINIEQRRDGSDLLIRGYFQAGTIQVTPATMSLPTGLTVRSDLLDASDINQVFGYYIQAAGTQVISNNDYIGGAIGNHLNVADTVVFGARTIAGGIFYDNATTIFSNNSVVTISGELRIPIEGWQNSPTVYQPDLSAWYLDGEIYNSTNGNQFYFGLVDNSTFTTPNQADHQLVLKPGSVDAKITCSGTNPPTGLTCSAGNEEPGVNFYVPTAGSVEVCFQYGHYVDTTAGRVRTIFSINETPDNSQTATQECGPFVESGIDSGTAGSHYPTNVCGICKFTSAGNKTLRLQSVVEVNGTVSLNSTDSVIFNGVQAKIKVTAKPVTQNIPAPVLIGQVSSSALSPIRLETAFVNCSATSIVNSQFGSFVSSIGNIAAGACTVNFAAGLWTQAPHCTVGAAEAAAKPKSVGVQTTSTTSTIIDCTENNSATDCTSFDAVVTCVGPR